MHGLKQQARLAPLSTLLSLPTSPPPTPFLQTIESINLLRMRKTPFIIGAHRNQKRLSSVGRQHAWIQAATRQLLQHADMWRLCHK